MPDCPVHHAPMRPGKQPGNYYCSQWIGIGGAGANEKGFCNQRIKSAPLPPSPSAAGPPTDAGAGRRIAALQAAAQIHQATQAPTERVLSDADRFARWLGGGDS